MEPVVSLSYDPVSAAIQNNDVGSVITTRGAQNVNTVINPAANLSTTSTIWNLNIPANTCIARPKIRLYIQSTTTSTDANAAFPTNYCLRSNPIQALMDSCSIGVNGTNFDSQPSLIRSAFTRMHSDEEERKFWSITPTQLDHCSTAALAQALVSTSPFQGETSSYSSLEDPRQLFPYVQTLVAGTPSSATRQYVVTEEFSLDGILGPNQYLFNVKNLMVNLRWVADLSRGFSRYGSFAGVNTVQTISFYQQPELILEYTVPSIEIPPVYTNPCIRYEVAQQSIGVPSSGALSVPYNMSAGNTQNYVMQAQTYSSVPEKLVIYCNKTQSLITSQSDVNNFDGYMTITNCSVSINGQPSMLNSKTPQELFLMSRKNGLDMSWVEWSNRLGSVLIIDVAQDLPNLIPGEAKQTVIQIGLTLGNVFYQSTARAAVDTAYDCTIQMVAVHQGYALIGNNRCDVHYGISEMALAEASVNPIVENTGSSGGAFHHPVKMHHMAMRFHNRGAGFGSFIKGIWKGAQHVAKFINKVAPTVLDNVGLGAFSAPVRNISGAIANYGRPEQQQPAVEVEGGKFRKRLLLQGSGRLH